MNIQTFLLLFIVLVLGISIRYFLPEAETNKRGTAMKVIGWIPFWDQEEAFRSFASHAELFDSIAVFWHTCSPDGRVNIYQNAVVDPKIIEFAHQHNVKVLATIANLADYTEKETWNPDCVSSIISSKEKRTEHIRELVALTEQYNFDGIAVDYEALPAAQKENFSIFIEELAQALHTKGKLLGVAIHPKTSEDNPDEDNGSHAQDLGRIARAVDSLYYMTYLEHGTFSDPGPPGGIEWMKQVLQYSTDDLHLPREKIYMGIGLMGVTWKQQEDGSYQGESSDNTFQNILSLTQMYGTPISWDPVSRSPFFTYQDENGNHVVWFENSHSFEIRYEYAKSLGIGGIALWRLGEEDEHIWKILSTKQ